MLPQQITLRVLARSFDTILESLIDGERVPIDINTAKLIEYLTEDLPQEVQQPFTQQCAAFLERVCAAGDEATLIREYLGDLVVSYNDSENLPAALSALTGKDLVVNTSLSYVRTWVRTVVRTLDEPYITKLVVAALMSRREWPEGKDEFRQLFLSLQ